MEKHYHSKAHQVQILANLFIENLLSYGRLHEGTLIRKFYMRTGFWKLYGLLPARVPDDEDKTAGILPDQDQSSPVPFENHQEGTGD